MILIAATISLVISIAYLISALFLMRKTMKECDKIIKTCEDAVASLRAGKG
jgi:uncharacterized protein YoxC